MATSVILRINNVKFTYISKDLHNMGEVENFQLRFSPLMKSRLSIFPDPPVRDPNVEYLPNYRKEVIFYA